MAFFLVTGGVSSALAQATVTYVDLSCDQPGGAGARIERRMPVMRYGRVHEIVDFPSAPTGTEWRASSGEPIPAGCFNMRKLGWLERTVRMLYRVGALWLALTPSQRSACGLEARTVLLDLPAAFRAATKPRMTWSLARYEEWAARFVGLDAASRADILGRTGQWRDRPRFHVLVLAASVPEGPALAATLASLSSQLYPASSVEVLVHAPRLGELVRRDKRDGWLMLVRAGDRLADHALYEFARAARAHPDVLLIYSDDDVIEVEGQHGAPRFKPDWSITHLRATDYIGSAVVLRSSAVAALGKWPWSDEEIATYDLLLRVGERASKRGVIHIPAVLLHRAPPALQPGAVADVDARCMTALRLHLERRGVMADVLWSRPGCWRVKYALPDQPPLVSIIVPTRDAVELLRRCVDSLLGKTIYPNFQILVVDNQSRDAEALEYLNTIADGEKLRVLRYAAPFNYSAINNFAVKQAEGEVICLLNNDTEVIAPDWLDEMVGHLLQDRVGVVGAKLYFPDGRVQHGGDTVGPGGCASHLHSLIGRDDPGYCNRAIVAQELSAVTAACLVTWKALYERLGGLDQKHLPVAFNDVDYCLRVREAGYAVVWTPHAELYHHESVSRGKDKSLVRRLRARREVRYMRSRWRIAMRDDPFYNPNFSYKRADFVLGSIFVQDNHERV